MILRKRNRSWLTIGLCCALMWSCGGTGNSEKPTVSQMAGSYQGNWTRPENGDTGIVQLTIGNDGSVTGSCVHSRFGQSSNVFGEARDGGRLKIHYAFPTNDPDVTIGVSHDRGGRLQFAENGHLTGTLSELIGDFNTPINYDLTRL